MKKAKYENADYRRNLMRGIMYLTGLFILAIGVSFSIISNLGVSPLSSIPYVVSSILEMDLGMCTTLIFVLFIGVQILIMKKEFQIKNLFQLISSAIFGVFVSVAQMLTSWMVVGDNYIQQLMFCVLGIICIAWGIYIYLESEVLSLPAEGLMEAMMYRFKMERPKAKLIFDCSVVVISCILSLIAFGTIIGIREGTVLTALGVAPCLKGIKWMIIRLKK